MNRFSTHLLSLCVIPATWALAAERGGVALIVGHSNTVPELVAAVGGPRLQDLAEDRYGDLLILTVPRLGKSTFLHLRFGAEGGAPYAAFRQMLCQVLRDGSEDGFDLPGSVLAELLTLTPELRHRYPDVPPNQSP